MSSTGSILWVDAAEIGTTLDGTDDQKKWEFISPAQRQAIAEAVFESLITNDTVWQEYHNALDVALAEVPMPDEPWCNHDAVAIKDGVCECGTPVAQIRRVDFTVGGV